MPSFGENLRREREKRNITLDQISQSTKIGTRMLQALEEDRFSQLPGGIFNKGFVRAYARCIGIDEDQAVAEYLEASGEVRPLPPETPPPEPVPRIEATAQTRERELPWGMFAALLLLAALALSLWSHRQNKNDRAVTLPSSHPVSRSAAPVGQPANTAYNPAPGSTDKSSDARDSAPSGVTSTALAATANTTTTANAATTVTNPPPGASAASPQAEFLVVIQAREDSWTTISSDGRTVYSGILRSGDQRAIRGRTEVVVKLGNAGGIDLFFNGNQLQRPGVEGEVRIITFGPAGVLANDVAPPLAQ